MRVANIPSFPPSSLPLAPPTFRVKPSIVIPCYNEAATIRSIVERVRDASTKNKKIIVVDDCQPTGSCRGRES